MIGELFLSLGNRLYDIIIGIVILLIGFTIGTVARNVLKKVLREIETDKIAQKMGFQFLIGAKVSTVVSYLIYGITIILFLNQLGLTPYIAYAIILVVLLLFGLTVVLGLKDFVPNAVAGLSLQQEKRFGLGRKIAIKGITGTIIATKVTKVLVETPEGDVLHVPYVFFKKSKLPP